MKTEVCCLPCVSEPVAIFRRFFIPVCKFRGTEWEPVLHTACERGWRTSCAGVCTGSSEQLFPVCKGSFPTWQHQFPAEIWWAGLGFSCNAHEFTSVGKLEQLSHLMPDWGPFWAHSNLQQHHLVLRGCSLHGNQGSGEEGVSRDEPGTCFGCLHTSKTFKGAMLHMAASLNVMLLIFFLYFRSMVWPNHWAGGYSVIYLGLVPASVT